MLWLIAVIAGAAILYLVFAAKAPHAIHQKFGLNPDHWTIVSSDLGGGHSRQRLYGFGVAGEPDAVLRGNRTGQIAVGEFKNRRHGGYVRQREFYQLILYIGLAREVYRSTNVVGVLAFKDARVEIAHDDALFRALIGMRGEVLDSIKRRKPLNRSPLHKRINIAAGNRKVRFPR